MAVGLLMEKGLMALLGSGVAYVTIKGMLDLKGIGKSKEGLKDLLKHVYIIGQTGTGKTTFLVNRIHDYLEHGTVIFIVYKDQKTAYELLDSVNDELAKDTIYINPLDDKKVVGIGTYGEDRSKNSLYADSLLSIYKTIWGESIGASSEDIFRMIFLGVADMDIRTPLEVYKCLSDKSEHGDYRMELLNKTKNPFVKEFFTWELPKKLNNYQAISPPRNKQRKLVAEPLICNTLCQSKPKLNLEKILTDKKKRLIIANFNQEILGSENASFLASIFLEQVRIATFTRKDKSMPIFVVADEFQDYICEDTFDTILSQARGFNMSFTLAHQYTRQIPASVSYAIDGNVANTYYFRVGKQDARYLKPILDLEVEDEPLFTFNKDKYKRKEPKFDMLDLINMPDYEYLVERLVDGKKVSLHREKAPGPRPIFDNREFIRMATNVRYGTCIKEIEKDVLKRLGFDNTNFQGGMTNNEISY